MYDKDMHDSKANTHLNRTDDKSGLTRKRVLLNDGTSILGKAMIHEDSTKPLKNKEEETP